MTHFKKIFLASSEDVFSLLFRERGRERKRPQCEREGHNLPVMGRGSNPLSPTGQGMTHFSEVCSYSIKSLL